MKRCGGLWDELISWTNLVTAARKAQRGKRDRVEVQRFNFSQEQHLIALQRDLKDGTYCPGAFRTHWITRPKPRMISVAPYRDRVVHHALMNLLEPILDRRFHRESYACRKGKGAHAAADRLQYWMGRRRYALQCDVVQFFPSIDHEILKGKFRRMLKDKHVLALMDRIVDSSNEQRAEPAWFPGDMLLTPVERRRGLPIGNLTSQWFANWFLDGLDHFVTSGCGLGAYVRYCDDFIILDDDPSRLWETLTAIRRYLASMRLALHEPRAHVRPVTAGLTFVGYRCWATHRLLRKRNVRVFRRRVTWMKREYARGHIQWDAVKARLASWIGYAQRANSRRLLRRLSREWVFSRAEVKDMSCHPRRRVEQQRHEQPDHQPEHEHVDQSEQQHWVPFGPALSLDARHRSGNHAVYGLREGGVESPDPRPESTNARCGVVGRICLLGSNGAGRDMPESPVRPVLRAA